MSLVAACHTDMLPEPSRQHWVRDDDAKTCAACDTEFWFFTRRHHCRSCGRIFCYEHCSKKLPLNSEGTPIQGGLECKVCDNCYEIGTSLLEAETTSHTTQAPTQAQSTLSFILPEYPHYVQLPSELTTRAGTTCLVGMLLQHMGELLTELRQFHEKYEALQGSPVQPILDLVSRESDRVVDSVRGLKEATGLLQTALHDNFVDRSNPDAFTYCHACLNTVAVAISWVDSVLTATQELAQTHSTGSLTGRSSPTDDNIDTVSSRGSDASSSAADESGSSARRRRGGRRRSSASRSDADGDQSRAHNSRRRKGSKHASKQGKLPGTGDFIDPRAAALPAAAPTLEGSVSQYEAQAEALLIHAVSEGSAVLDRQAVQDIRTLKLRIERVMAECLGVGQLSLGARCRQTLSYLDTHLAAALRDGAGSAHDSHWEAALRKHEQTFFLLVGDISALDTADPTGRAECKQRLADLVAALAGDRRQLETSITDSESIQSYAAEHNQPLSETAQDALKVAKWALESIGEVQENVAELEWTFRKKFTQNSTNRSQAKRANDAHKAQQNDLFQL